jgi:acyl-CoA dehydrogenase
VARRVLKGYVPHEVPSEHIPTRRAEARRRFADLLEKLTADA